MGHLPTGEVAPICAANKHNDINESKSKDARLSEPGIDLTVLRRVNWAIDYGKLVVSILTSRHAASERCNWASRRRPEATVTKSDQTLLDTVPDMKPNFERDGARRLEMSREAGRFRWRTDRGYYSTAFWAEVMTAHILMNMVESNPHWKSRKDSAETPFLSDWDILARPCCRAKVDLGAKCRVNQSLGRKLQ